MLAQFAIAVSHIFKGDKSNAFAASVEKKILEEFDQPDKFTKFYQRIKYD